MISKEEWAEKTLRNIGRLEIQIITDSNKENLKNCIDYLQSVLPRGNFIDSRVEENLNEMEKLCVNIRNNSENWLRIIHEIQESYPRRT